MTNIVSFASYRTKQITDGVDQQSELIEKQNELLSHSANECEILINDVSTDHMVLIDKCDMFLEKLKQSRKFAAKCENAWNKKSIEEMILKRNHLTNRRTDKK